MKKWLSGVRGAVAMVLTWTVGWGLGFGGLIEAFVDPHGEIVDVWLTVLAVPGFVGGVLFSVLLRLSEGRRGFDEAPLSRAAALGAATGLVLGGFGTALGLASPHLWSVAALLGVATALGAVAGLGAVVFFCLLARRTVAGGRVART